MIGDMFPPLGAQKIILNPNVPLTRTEDGLVVGVLYWVIDGVWHVHPDRWAQYFEPVLGPFK